jgi:hypothetical protein
MNTKTKNIIAALLLVCISLPFAAADKKKNPSVIPVGAHAFGTTYEQLAADLWVRAFSIPAPDHPHFDLFGEFHDLGQSGKVEFLVGHLQGAPVNRIVTISAGKSLFFPMIDFAEVCAGSAEDMRGWIAEIVEHVVDLWVTVDGEPIGNLFDYRIASNVFAAPDGGLLPPVCLGTPGVADGYYLLLPPLSKGNHVIEFGGAVEGFNHPVYGTIPDISQDAVYIISVE